jgi:hypothetical protein
VLLHERKDFGDLLAVVGREQAIDPGLVEKDYWIMHALWGLQQLGFTFALKGGTSLSKGYGIIHRFSEDIDILIRPAGALPIGKNQDKKDHVDARRGFFDGLPSKIGIAGFHAVERDEVFDDARMRSAGIRMLYESAYALPDGVKSGVLLEAGFDQVAPNRPCLIGSWAYDRAAASGLEDLTDNRALDVACYEPGYTLVEKLQTISTKYRHFLEHGDMPANFLRHYYDVYCLLDDPSVDAFIGTDAYTEHKRRRFRQADERDIAKNPAFHLTDGAIRRLFEKSYLGTGALYYRGQPEFNDLIERIERNSGRL